MGFIRRVFLGGFFIANPVHNPVQPCIICIKQDFPALFGTFFKARQKISQSYALFVKCESFQQVPKQI
jgi:hypothetical protein